MSCTPVPSASAGSGDVCELLTQGCAALHPIPKFSGPAAPVNEVRDLIRVAGSGRWHPLPAVVDTHVYTVYFSPRLGRGDAAAGWAAARRPRRARGGPHCTLARPLMCRAHTCAMQHDPPRRAQPSPPCAQPLLGCRPSACCVWSGRPAFGVRQRLVGCASRDCAGSTLCGRAECSGRAAPPSPPAPKLPQPPPLPPALVR